MKIIEVIGDDEKGASCRIQGSWNEVLGGIYLIVDMLTDHYGISFEECLNHIITEVTLSRQRVTGHRLEDPIDGDEEEKTQGWHRGQDIVQ